MPGSSTSHAAALRLHLSNFEPQLVPSAAATGLSIERVAGVCGEGAATIRIGAGPTAAFRAPGSGAFGSAVALSADGDYLLEDGDDPDAWVTVHATVAYCTVLGDFAIDLHWVYDDPLLGFGDPDVSGGAFDNYELATLEFLGSTGLVNVKIWIDPCCVWNGTAGVRLSTDGSNWYAPDSESHGDVIEFSTLSSDKSLWVRLTYPADQPASAKNIIKIHASWDGQ